MSVDRMKTSRTFATTLARPRVSPVATMAQQIAQVSPLLGEQRERSGQGVRSPRFASLRLPFLLLSLLLFAAACSDSPARPSGSNSGSGDGAASNLNVSMNVFSGRPNPAWALSSAQAGTFDAMFRALSNVDPASLPAAGADARLGYRGLLLTRAGAASAELGQISVYGGAVLYRDEAGAARYKADDGRTLERWLVTSGRAHLEQQVYDLAMNDIEGR